MGAKNWWFWQAISKFRWSICYFESFELLCVGGFVFVSYFSQSSEIPDQTSSVSCTANALFDLLPGNLGRPKLRTSKLSISFFFVMRRWKAERFFCSFTCLFNWLSENSVPPFHARDRTFLAFTYGSLIKQIFHMLTDSAIQLLWGYRFLTAELSLFCVRLAMFLCLFYRSASQLVLDIVWHFFRPNYIRT